MITVPHIFIALHTVIFQGNGDSVPINWVYGMDIIVDESKIIQNDDGEVNFGLNNGAGKFYPGLPSCQLLGKEIHPLVFVSESGGITFSILVSICKHFDRLGVFD